MKNFGNAKIIIGMKIFKKKKKRVVGILFLSEERYINNVSKMLNIKD